MMKLFGHKGKSIRIEILFAIVILLLVLCMGFGYCLRFVNHVREGNRDPVPLLTADDIRNVRGALQVVIRRDGRNPSRGVMNSFWAGRVPHGTLPHPAAIREQRRNFQERYGIIPPGGTVLSDAQMFNRIRAAEQYRDGILPNWPSRHLSGRALEERLQEMYLQKNMKRENEKYEKNVKNGGQEAGNDYLLRRMEKLYRIIYEREREIEYMRNTYTPPETYGEMRAREIEEAGEQTPHMGKYPKKKGGLAGYIGGWLKGMGEIVERHILDGIVGEHEKTEDGGIIVL